ncbi:MAG TPA: hypothetical protein PLR83_02435 [Pyrinomonadaceae bacterium]|nr:hypothetical protein [Pyrinomonadaceae bacterium]
MEYFVGAVSAVALIIFGRVSGFEKDRSFYPTVLIVIGFLYVLFGALDGRASVVLIEIAFALVFSAVAIIGYKKGCLIVAAGIAAHGLFDFVRQFFIEDRGVPVWWPGFCGTIDVLLGLLIAYFVCRKPANRTPVPRGAG